MNRGDYRSAREMFRKEYLPEAIAIGIRESEFWGLNPHGLMAYNKAYLKAQKQNDWLAWMLGHYVLRAIGATLDGRKNPYPKAPYMQDMDESGIDRAKSKKKNDVEKQKAVEQLFLKLNIMATNYNLTHPKKDGKEPQT